MPSAKSETTLLCVIATLLLAAVAALAVDPQLHRSERQSSRQFQELVHGLGFGPTLELSTCEFAFDPRLNQACPWDCRCTPGGRDFCSKHACSILAYRRPTKPAERLTQ